MTPINLNRKLAAFDDLWAPKVVVAFNSHDVMVVKVKGEFVWHAHPDTDDLFLVPKGRLTIQLRDGEVRLGPGDLHVVPAGVEHCPSAIILVGGIMSDRSWVEPLAKALSANFTTIAVDRRGRGNSDDGPGCSVASKIEDIAAVIAIAGDRSSLYGYSSDAALALPAAAEGLPIGSLVLYEPPFSAEDAPEVPEPYVAEVLDQVAARRRW